MKQKKAAKQKNPLPLLAGVVLIAAVMLTLLPKVLQGNSSAYPESITMDNGINLVVRTSEIGASASYFDYDANGTTVQFFAVRASDDTIRLALNTCQVCNGPPYAYFEQEGDVFVCQNCKNRFASTEVGKVSGGCNPVPITDGDYTEQDGVIMLPAAFLEENAYRFTNWKKF